MIDIKTVRKFALEFEEAVEKPHFEKTSFRVRKKIFATLDTKKKTLTLKFSPADQSAFSAFDDSVIYPVAGSWGRHGWTVVELAKVESDIFVDALTTSYCRVAPAKLAEKYRPPEENL